MKGILKYKKGKKNWIQSAVNPEHEGFCSPVTKKTCTPRRKAFAMTMKKHHGFHKKEEGGLLKFQLGGITQDATRINKPQYQIKTKPKSTQLPTVLPEAVVYGHKDEITQNILDNFADKNNDNFSLENYKTIWNSNIDNGSPKVRLENNVRANYSGKHNQMTINPKADVKYKEDYKGEQDFNTKKKTRIQEIKDHLKNLDYSLTLIKNNPAYIKGINETKKKLNDEINKLDSSNYNQLGSRGNAKMNVGDYFAELSHAKQFKEAPFMTTLRGIQGQLFYEDSDDKEKGRYGVEGQLEHEAHSVIEPELKKKYPIKKQGGVLKYQDSGVMTYITPIWNKVKRDATRMYKEMVNEPQEISPKDKVKSINLRQGKFKALNPTDKLEGEASMILPTTMDDAAYTTPDKIKQGEYVIGTDENGKVIIGKNQNLSPKSKVGYLPKAFVNPVDSVAYNNQTKKIETWNKRKPVYNNLQSGGDGQIIMTAPNESRYYATTAWDGKTMSDSLNAFIKRNPQSQSVRVDNGRFTARFKKDTPLTQQDYKDYLSDSFVGQGGMVLVQKRGGIFKFQNSGQLPESLKTAKNTFATQQQINEANKTYQARINAGQVQRQDGSWMTKEQHQQAIKDSKTPKKGTIDVDYSDPLTMGITALAAPGQGLLKAATSKVAPKLNTVGKAVREGIDMIDPTSIGFSKSISSDLLQNTPNINLKNIQVANANLTRQYNSPEFVQRAKQMGLDNKTIQQMNYNANSLNNNSGYFDVESPVYKQHYSENAGGYVEKNMFDKIPLEAKQNPVYKATIEDIKLNQGKTRINPKLSDFNQKTIQTHEGTHKITDADNLIPENVKKELQSVFKKDDYFTTPTEIHARMNQMRHLIDSKNPYKKIEYSDIFDNNGNLKQQFEEVTGSSKEKFGSFIKDRQGFVNLMNKMYGAIPAAIGTGLGIKASTNDNKSLRIGGKFKRRGIFNFR